MDRGPANGRGDGGRSKRSGDARRARGRRGCTLCLEIVRQSVPPMARGTAGAGFTSNRKDLKVSPAEATGDDGNRAENVMAAGTTVDALRDLGVLCKERLNVPVGDRPGY